MATYSPRMLRQALPALVTCLALVLLLILSFAVGRAREKHGIAAPATTGHPQFERAYRVQMNTLEQFVAFLPSLWLFAFFVSPLWAAVLGLVWLIARVAYAVVYLRNPAARAPATPSCESDGSAPPIRTGRGGLP